MMAAATATSEAATISTAIANIKERLGELRLNVEDLREAHFKNPDGEPVGLEAATRLVAEATILRHETGWFSEDVDHLLHDLIQVRYVESEGHDDA
jgi:hypothetical protein